MTSEQQVRSGTIRMRWDPEARLATIAFDAPTRATGADARVLVDALEGWIGSERRPFGLLGDGGKLSGVDAEYRAIWGAFFRQHRDVFLAFFGMGPLIRIAAEMFGRGVGLRLRAFGHEHQARAWLRKMGIPA